MNADEFALSLHLDAIQVLWPQKATKSILFLSWHYWESLMKLYNDTFIFMLLDLVFIFK